jgi:hypothetical protein
MTNPISIESVPIVVPADEDEVLLLADIAGVPRAARAAVSVVRGSGTSAAWGSITGTLAAQTDLNAALASKRASSTNIPASEVDETATRKWLTDTERTKLAGIEANATADLTVAEIVALLDAYFGGTAWRSGAAVQPLEFRDEGTTRGQPPVVNFIGAGVTAGLNGTTLDVTIPGGSAAAGAERTLQYNASGALAGAAGVKVASPTNADSLTDHIVKAANIAFRFPDTVSVAAGGTIEPNARVAAWQRYLLAGDATISAASMPGSADLAVLEAMATRVTLSNFSGAARTVTVITNSGTAGYFAEAWVNSIAVPNNGRVDVMVVARRLATGTVNYALIA